MYIYIVFGLVCSMNVTEKYNLNILLCIHVVCLYGINQLIINLQNTENSCKRLRNDNVRTERICRVGFNILVIH